MTGLDAGGGQSALSGVHDSHTGEKGGGRLIFIGLGLSEKGITVEGLEAARGCDVLFRESYTSLSAEVGPHDAHGG
ncbi:MAG: hypothetical protein J7L61_01315, partial [Thermoplasmata archaeon]|nr:hypothetical protein [Thermoplasmata archaeon]